LRWANFKDPTVVNALEDALDDPEVNVRLEAARSLARLGSVGSVPGLVAVLEINVVAGSADFSRPCGSIGA
tara:strand:- start:7719 stop:7931 length:213 start_codon:yes stop_codon:yes gene_type:complete